jgi:hypothetical protein
VPRGPLLRWCGAPLAGPRLSARGVGRRCRGACRSCGSQGRGPACVRKAGRCGRERTEPAGGGEAGEGAPQLPPGPRCACASRPLKPKHVQKTVLFGSWEVFAASVPTAGAGGDPLSEKVTRRRGRGARGLEGDPEGIGSKGCTWSSPCVSFSADLSQRESCHFSTGLQNRASPPRRGHLSAPIAVCLRLEQ